MHRRTILSILFIALAGAAPAHADDDASGTLQAWLDRVDALQAQFSQTVTDADGNELEHASGALALRRPGRFRWDYETPEGQLVLADGERVWLYDAELAQVTVRPEDEALSASPASLLSGGTRLTDHYRVADTWQEGDTSWVDLEPRTSGRDFVHVRVGMVSGTLRAMELDDALGQKTRIELAAVVENPHLDDALFRFVPPKGVDVIGDVGS